MHYYQIEHSGVFTYLPVRHFCCSDFYYLRETQQCETENRNLFMDRYSSYVRQIAKQKQHRQNHWTQNMIWLSSNNKKKQNKTRDKRIRAQSTKKMCARTSKIKRSSANFVPFYKRSCVLPKKVVNTQSTLRWSVNVCCIFLIVLVCLWVRASSLNWWRF